MTVPEFEPPPEAGPQPEPVKLIASVLATLAGVVAVAGSFLPLSVLSQTFGQLQTITISASSWTRTVESGSSFGTADMFGPTGHVPYYGIPLTLFAVVLFAAAATGVLTARRPSNATARPLLLIGGSGLVAAVLTLIMEVSSAGSYEQTGDDFQLLCSTGSGFWLEIAAAVLALGAVVVALLPDRAPEPDSVPPPDGPDQEFIHVLPSQEPPPDYQPSSEPPAQLPVPPRPSQPHQQPPLFPPNT